MNLIVMAAGMGSRFGGLKQLTAVGPNGEFLIDYSIYDAIKVGVTKVIFVIQEEHLEQFRETIGRRIEDRVEVEYVFQKIEDIPISLSFDVKRTKPWGTGQALLACRDYVDDQFMIVNADDFYGRDAFQTLANFLKKQALEKGREQDKKHYAMVAYQLRNTLSQNGTVSRGVCEVENGYLKKVTERTKVEYQNNKIVYLEDGKAIGLAEDSLVSVNLFGFTKEVFEDVHEYFVEFLTQTEDLTAGEFYIPSVVQKSIDNKRADVKVLSTTSKFYGMTYREDLEKLKQDIYQLIKAGIYPEDLWSDGDEE